MMDDVDGNDEDDDNDNVTRTIIMDMNSTTRYLSTKLL